MARAPSRSGNSKENGAGQGAGIAFFDFDNTIIHGDAGPLFGRALYGQRRAKRKRIGRAFLFVRHIPYISAMALQAGLYKLHARRRSSIVRSAYKGLRGLDAREFYNAMGQFVDEKVAPRIYPEIAERIRQHTADGIPCVIVTTGMEPLVEHCVRHLPAPVTVIGCHLLERKGRLTGQVDGPLFGVDKANILKAYCKAMQVDPAQCWAYSDHWSDKQMLETVGHGVTVNPRGPLLRMARAKGWEILEPKAPVAPN
ncbi:MAG: HAD family hydrolase [Candidatus Thermoplasmatota archaeon]